MKGIKLRCPERMWRNFQSRIVWVFSPQRMASRNFFLKRSMRRPRLVIYNINAEELHPVLAEIAARLDSGARWAGNQLSLPRMGLQLHLDSLDMMRNVSLVSSGGRQNLDGWRRLASELGASLRTLKVRRNSRAVGFLLISLALMTASMTHLLLHQDAITQAMNEVFAH